MVSLERLFSRKELHQAEREKFEEGAGWRYGLVFAGVLVAVAWGWDAWDLARASADLYWAKLVLASVTLIPLGALAGGITARLHHSMIARVAIWIACGALTGLIAIHLPFEGASLIASIIDPATRGVTLFPFPPAAEERVALVMVFGALAGFLAVPLQTAALAWAWDRSTAQSRITPGGWAMLFVSAPLAISLAALYDGSANAQLRGPFQLAERQIQVALTTPPDLDISKMETLRALEYVSVSQWRGKFSAQHTAYLANFDRTGLKTVNIDVAFDNGFVWRCQSVRNGDDLTNCIDLNKAYTDLMTQFLRTGAAACAQCSVHMDASAAAWRAQHPRLDAPQNIAITHRAGGMVLVRANYAAGASVTCRFFGADLVELLDCQ